MKALIEEGEQEIGIKMQGLALAEGNLYHPFFSFQASVSKRCYVIYHFGSREINFISNLIRNVLKTTAKFLKVLKTQLKFN